MQKLQDDDPAIGPVLKAVGSGNYPSEDYSHKQEMPEATKYSLYKITSTIASVLMLNKK